jgi:2-C-methyl-D-erythritol 4-phosphate cytidylyltransferase
MPCVSGSTEEDAMTRFTVILPAAGKSSRDRDKEKKVFASIDGRAVWLCAAEAFVDRKDVALTLVVIAHYMDTFRTRSGAHLGLLGVEVVPCGAERFESVGNALARVRDNPGSGG